MRWMAVTLVVLATGGCGPLVDADYPGPPWARLRYTISDSARSLGATTLGLLWNLEDGTRGNHYNLPMKQQWLLRSREDVDVPLDVYGDMPGGGDLGVALVALFDAKQWGTPIVIDGAHFVDQTSLVAVDTTHVLLFARAKGPSFTGALVWPHDIVVDNPEQLSGPGYHLAEVRCGADGAPGLPTHVALVDEPLDRDEARPLFQLEGDQALAEQSEALAGIPRGARAGRCLVLP